MLSEYEVALRILAGTVAGMVIGIDRAEPAVQWARAVFPQRGQMVGGAVALVGS